MPNRISRLHVKKHEFTLQVEVKSSNFVISCYLQSEDYGNIVMLYMCVCFSWLLHIVGIDVYKEIKTDVDPRKYITVTGQSNLSTNPEPRKKKVEQISDDFDDDIDPQVWNEIAAVSAPTIIPNTGSQRPTPSTSTKRNDSSQKKAVTDEPKKP